MPYGLCTLSIIPLRLQPQHRSEMTSQVLFGETLEILDRNGPWSLVRLSYDNYEGWVETRQIESISEELYQDMNQGPKTVSDLSTHAILMKLGRDEMQHLVPGSTLPIMEEDGLFTIGLTNYMFLGLAKETRADDLQDEVEEVARFYLNAPYLWGGRSVFGIDCSGLSQMVFKHFGIVIPRDAYQQATQGKTVDFLQEARAGDLAFFDSEEGKITHVGILLNNSEIIHASAKVRVDPIDENGIFNSDTQSYSHRLRIIKRLYPKH